MASVRRAEVIRGFRAIFEGGSAAGMSDGELLERAMARSGPAAEIAFAALVERHGSMVYRVCKQVLGDPHEAHDAFQSTFLVLARKAGGIRERDSVASWLHGVALRVSASSRAARARRRKHERIGAGLAPTSLPSREPDDQGAVLHEEVGRLPGRYRQAVVLCYLEGKSCEEAAGDLDCPVGTVKSRLAWARQRLRDRLTLRGLAPASAGVAALLAAEAASAAVPLPGPWIETTTTAALRFAAESWASTWAGTVPASATALAHGVIRAMILNKLKIAAVAGGSLLAVSGLGYSAAQQDARNFHIAEGRPAHTQAQAEPDRLKSLETKLDRLISALEGTKGGLTSVTATTTGAKPATAVTGFQAPTTTSAVATVTKEAAVNVQGKPVVVTTTRDDKGRVLTVDHAGPSTHVLSGQIVATQAPDRVGALEEKFAKLEQRIAALEKKAGLGSIETRTDQVVTIVADATASEKVDVDVAEIVLGEPVRLVTGTVKVEDRNPNEVVIEVEAPKQP